MNETSRNAPPASGVTVIFMAGARPTPAMDGFDVRAAEIPGIGERLQAKSAEELLEILQGADRAVVILCVSDKDELVKVVTLLQTLKATRPEGSLRVLVFNGIEVTKVHTLLMARGCHDVLAFSLSRQGVLKKIHYNVMLVKNASGARGASTTVGKSGASNAAASSKEPTLIWSAAVESAADCWLMRKNHVKCVLGSWLMELTGPGPAAGAWKSVSPDAKEEERLWEWVPRGSACETLIGESGKWQIFAKQPEFLWKLNRYKIVSRKPELKFLRDGNQPTLYRFRPAPGGGLEIAENSERAKDKLPLILNTFDSSIVIRQDRAKKPGEDFVMTDDASGAAWGQGDLRPDEAAEWGGDGSRAKEESSGSGIGLGQGKGRQGYGYDDPVFEARAELEGVGKDFLDAVAAFEKVQLSVLVYPDHDETKEPVTAELLENEGNLMQIDAEARFGEVGKSLLIDLVSTGKKTNKCRLEIRVDSAEDLDDARQLLFCTIVSGNMQALQSMVSDFVQRQQEILKFLEEAKGY